MNKLFIFKVLFFAVVFLFFTDGARAQTKPLLKRTTYKTDSVDFGAGGTIAVIGAPNGAVSIEGWQKNQVEISAEIEVQAETEADLATLSKVCGYSFDQTLGRVSIVSFGTNDKDYIKRVDKKFPKNLLSMPFKIDYKIKVPVYADLEIDGGSGDFKLANVDGTMKINFLNSNADLTLSGGAISATFGGGKVSVTIPNRNWRGRLLDVQMVSGELNINLPVNLNAEITAKVLREGRILNSNPELKPLSRTQFTAKNIFAKAGNGGVPLSFTVGDGNLNIAPVEPH